LFFFPLPCQDYDFFNTYKKVVSDMFAKGLILSSVLSFSSVFLPALTLLLCCHSNTEREEYKNDNSELAQQRCVSIATVFFLLFLRPDLPFCPPLSLSDIANNEKMFEDYFSEEKYNQLIKDGKATLSYKASQAAIMINLYQEVHFAVSRPPFSLLLSKSNIPLCSSGTDLPGAFPSVASPVGY
jgi:hypothetical protein